MTAMRCFRSSASPVSRGSSAARRFPGRLALVAGLILLVSWPLRSAPARAQEQDPQARRSSAQERRSELRAIREQIRELEGRLGEVRERELGLRERLERVELELELQSRRLEEAETARELASSAVEASEAEVGRLERRLSEARGVLRKRLVGLYRLGRQGYLRLFLSARPGDDLLASVRTLRYLVQRDAEAVRRYVQAREDLQAERRTLLAQQEEAERWAREEEERRDRLAAVRQRQSRLVAEARRERRRLAREAEELEVKERRLADLISALAEAAGRSLDGRPLQGFQGVLDWPLEGEVTAGFGPRLDPRYGTRVPHNGIEIDTEPGSEVTAVYPGKVLFSDPLEGYGPTVVMLHPGRVFTLYAKLSRLRVSSEDVLSLGDVVGTSSDHLYFEIRVENRPQDPLLWLR